jgi:hypothetical protein
VKTYDTSLISTKNLVLARSNVADAFTHTRWG